MKKEANFKINQTSENSTNIISGSVNVIMDIKSDTEFVKQYKNGTKRIEIINFLEKNLNLKLFGMQYF